MASSAAGAEAEAAQRPLVLLGIDPDTSGALAVVRWQRAADARGGADGLPAADIEVYDMPMMRVQTGTRARKCAQAGHWEAATGHQARPAAVRLGLCQRTHAACKKHFILQLCGSAIVSTHVYGLRASTKIVGLVAAQSDRRSGGDIAPAGRAAFTAIRGDGVLISCHTVVQRSVRYSHRARPCSTFASP